MIIYPYRDAIDALKEIVSEAVQPEGNEKQRLADACRDYLEWAGEDEDDEDDEEEWEDEDA